VSASVALRKMKDLKIMSKSYKRAESLFVLIKLYYLQTRLSNHS